MQLCQNFGISGGCCWTPPPRYATVPSSQLDLFLHVEEASWIWKPSIHIHMHIYHKSVTPQYKTTVICGHDSLWKVIPCYKVFWFPTTHDIPSPLMQCHKLQWTHSGAVSGFDVICHDTEFSTCSCILCYNLYTSHHAVSLANSLGITKCFGDTVGGATAHYSIGSLMCLHKMA